MHMSCFLFAFTAGVAVVLQNSLNGLMTPWLGAVGTATVGFLVQLAAVAFCQLLTEHRLLSLKKVPLLCCATGPISVLVVGMTAVCVAAMGSAVTTCCSVAGQLIMSAVTDHFGLFGTEKHRFERKRVPGFLLILCGVLAMNLIGGAGGKAPLKMLLLGVLMGMCAIAARSLNYLCSKYTDSAYGGGIVSSLSGAVTGIPLYLILNAFRPDVSAFVQTPVVCYAAGVFGAVALLCNIMAYKTQQIFYATTFMLIGQIMTGIVMDAFLFHALSAGKVIGILIVLMGVFLDKMITRKS